MSDLLILGAGQFGIMVKEIAESTGVYSKIDFLDDKSNIAIGRLEEYDRFIGEYDYAIVAIGNPQTRCSYLKKIKARVKVASIISPFAYISKSSVIEEGSIIEPMAVIQTGSVIGEGCIVSSGAVVRHNSVVENYCHLDCNSVVMSNTTVPSGTKVSCLVVFKNN